MFFLLHIIRRVDLHIFDVWLTFDLQVHFKVLVLVLHRIADVFEVNIGECQSAKAAVFEGICILRYRELLKVRLTFVAVKYRV